MTNRKAKTSSPDIHQEVTDKIISLLDHVDLDDYQPPFSQLAAQGLPENPTTGNHYQGVNILALWFNQQSGKFTSNQWATFKQWKDNGAQVRKGEKGSRVIFYKTLLKSEENESGEPEEIKIPMLRLFTVFNANQVDGYEDDKNDNVPKTDKVQRIKLIDQFCAATGADIRTGESEAYYDKIEDYINMPETSMFLDTPETSATENYYSVLFHELTHWTGAEKRLDRPGITERIKTEDYAFEELIAELGGAFLAARHRITQTLPKNHAIYIKSWLQALKEDKTHIFKASAQAAKAVEYLNEITKTHPKLEIA
ncbi:zincin-like metallopeptidase domain-containing protein [Fulvivirgaceae bacterium BMA12]|uniref:Zincin-like metallopeptidase domain-containing protein n=1 Tax=Agaribacillus aureus TaxID=3051825 RepID=A0ABT8LCQ4_9BACT|nr:zincin-like metallopeptidase domain-containing protein [Fulvivirgaceae bacterium BMA12]